jgi:hypothetical protein
LRVRPAKALATVLCRFVRVDAVTDLRIEGSIRANYANHATTSTRSHYDGADDSVVRRLTLLRPTLARRRLKNL